LNWKSKIVEGNIRFAEAIEEATAVALCAMERVQVLGAVRMILGRTGAHPEIPIGPLNRVADNALAKEVLGWQTQVPSREGPTRVMDWYLATKNPAEVSAVLGCMLAER
jgi:nucleoside-diphosphate-sugar epimerase